MEKYTEQLENIKYEISPEDDNYTEELLSVAKSFRDFDETLDTFIINKGFIGDILNIDEKVEFIKDKFQKADILPLPRNIKKWFTEKKRIEKRKIAFQFCFAFKLDLKESEEFFRTVCLQRGFDCHYIEEAIYYYAISNELSYAETIDLLEKAPSDIKGKVDFNDEVLFTESIIKEINRFKSKEELIQFFNNNLEQFGYNNATAYKYIMKIWNEIKKSKGLAEREKALLFPNLINNGDKTESKKRSVWDIYLQILGLYDFDYDNSPLFVLDTDRTLKPILKNNDLLHPLAEDSFPDRQGLEAILRGEHKSNELVCKTIILLVFYEYWTKRLLKNNVKVYCADDDDNERCYAEINRYLIDAGYPTLYAGNPYDWIFLFAMQDEYPMETFRYFMRELYIIKEDELRASSDSVACTQKTI